MCYAIVKIEYLIEGHPIQMVPIEKSSDLLPYVRKCQSIQGVRKVSWYYLAGERELITEWKEKAGEKTDKIDVAPVQPIPPEDAPSAGSNLCEEPQIHLQSEQADGRE